MFVRMYMCERVLCGCVHVVEVGVEVRSSLGATRAYNASLCAAARLEKSTEEEPNCTTVDRPSSEDIRAA